jgi:invasion protein IalB
MGGLMRLTGLALLATVTLSFLAAAGAAIAQQAAKGVPQLGSVSRSSGTPLVPSP